MSSAPPAAWAAIGPVGLQMSSQIDTPDAHAGDDEEEGVALRRARSSAARRTPRSSAAAACGTRPAPGRGRRPPPRCTGRAPRSTKPTTAAQRPVRAATFSSDGEVVGHEAGLEQQVLGRVAGDRELGEHGDVAAGRLGPVEHGEQGRHVAVEVADDGVELAGGDPESRHTHEIYRAAIGLRPDRLPTVPSATLTEAVERSAAPAAVAVAVERLVEAHDGLAARLDADRGPARRDRRGDRRQPLADRRLPARRARPSRCWPTSTRRPALDADDADALARWKRLELLRIAARDLLGLDDLEPWARALAALAADVLDGAWRARRRAAAGGDRHGQARRPRAELRQRHRRDVRRRGRGRRRAQLMEIARDLLPRRRRPAARGRDGPLVRSLESYEAYWDRWAQPWEFQALLKARPVAGDARPRRRVPRPRRTSGCGSGRSPPTTSARCAAMKARAEDACSRARGSRDREVKRGPRRHPRHRVRGAAAPARARPQRPRPAFADHARRARRARAGRVRGGRRRSRARATPTASCATVEHRLQLVDEQQVHALPTDVAARTRLARVLGYRDTAEADALEQLDDALRRHQATVRSIHERLFFRPLLEALAGSASATLAPGEAETRLAAFGFTDPARTRQAVRELTRGLTRSSRLMQQLLPLLLEWLSRVARPRPRPARPAQAQLRAAARHRARHRVPRLARGGAAAVRRARHEPAARPRRSSTTPTSSPRSATPTRWRPARPRVLADGRQHRAGLARRPAGAAGRACAGSSSARSCASRRATCSGSTATTPRPCPRRPGSSPRWPRRCVRAALDAVGPRAAVRGDRHGPVRRRRAVLRQRPRRAVRVRRDDAAADFAAAEQTAEALLAFLGERGPGRIYDPDLDLRPEGKQGPLARSLDGYRAYYERWGQTWERQALVRARPVAGDAELGRRFMAMVDAHVWQHALTDDEVREIRRMKARIERERIPAGEDPSFHLKLGRGSLSDVEWTAQLLQLRARRA